MPIAVLITGGIILATALVIGFAVYMDHRNIIQRLDMTAQAIFRTQLIGLECNDDGNPQRVKTRILEKSHQTRTGSSLYTLIVEDWEQSGMSRTIHSTYSVYKEALPGESKLKMTIKPGWLGTPWIKKMKLAKRKT